MANCFRRIIMLAGNPIERDFYKKRRGSVYYVPACSRSVLVTLYILTLFLIGNLPPYPYLCTLKIETCLKQAGFTIKTLLYKSYLWQKLVR